MRDTYTVHIGGCATLNGMRWCNCHHWSWVCPNCQQTNSYWAERCGRCTRAKDAMCMKAEVAL